MTKTEVLIYGRSTRASSDDSHVMYIIIVNINWKFPQFSPNISHDDLFLYHSESLMYSIFVATITF